MICLVRCPSTFLIDERAFPPLGLMAVGAGLRRQGHDVCLYDRDLGDLPLDYPCYGFGPGSPEYPQALDALHRIKQRNPDARVVLGGTHATLNHRLCVRDGWDSIVVGDGEIEAERAFFGGSHLIFADSRPLDEYPAPDRTLLDPKSYRFKLQDKPTTTIIGSRGCPFFCGFCCKTEKSVRLRGVPFLLQEIDYLYDAFGYEALAFPEDIFILNRGRTEAICQHLKRRGIIWRCLVRADLVVKYGMDFLHMMADCGCVGVGVGVESGSDRILRIIRKGETAATIMAAIKMLQRARIFTKGFFVVGLPGENEQSLRETNEFLAEARMDDIDCKIFQPYPGSPIYDHRELYDIYWNEIPLEYTFYKGIPGVYYGNVYTSALTTDVIVESWKYFERTYKDYTKTAGVATCQN
jgi:anaerobic magnesium-protoporphyrin IX monomethyl ester cyclase